MAIRQIRRPAVSLRFRLGHYFRPQYFLGFFLAAILFQGFFEFFFRFTLGVSFLGLHARAFKIGMYGFVLLTTLYYLLREKPTRTPVRPGALLLALILLEVILGMGLAAYLGQTNSTMKAALYTDALLSILLIIPFAYAAVESVEDLYTIMRAFAFGLLVLAILELIARVGGAFLPPLRSLALSLYRLTLPFAAYFFLTAALASKRLHLTYLSYFVLITLGVLMAFDKPIAVPYLASTAFVVLLLLFLPHRRVLYGRKRILLGILIVIVLLVALVVIIELLTPFDFLGYYVSTIARVVFKYNLETGQSIGRVDGGRFYLYRQAWSYFLTNPLYGQGLGTGILSDGGIVIPPHSIYFDLLAGTGLVGTLPVVIGAIVFIFYILRNTDFTRMIDMKMAMLGYVVMALAFASVGVLWEYPYIYFLMAICIGCALKVATLDGNRRRPVA